MQCENILEVTISILTTRKSWKAENQQSFLYHQRNKAVGYTITLKSGETSVFRDSGTEIIHKGHKL